MGKEGGGRIKKLNTKVLPIKAHSMTQVPMTLTEGQGQRSRSNFPKNG